MEIGSLFIDTNSAQVFLNTNSTYTLVVLFMAAIGWVILAYLFIYIGIFFLDTYKATKYQEKWTWVNLAIDIPPTNLQTPKAVEQLFSHLGGARVGANMASKFRKGYRQRWFSLEIISIDGYIQFLIRTERKYRDLVEAAVYAQYPEVEITEVEDYTKDIPSVFPNEEYDMWGANIGLTEDYAYPIRTYVDFEHGSAEDYVIKDPMGTFLESFSRIGRGEQVWFQILIEPVKNDWKENVIKKIKDIVGDMVSFSPSGSKKSGGFASAIGSSSSRFLSEVSGQIFGHGPADVKSSSDDKKDDNRILKLTPGQRKTLEAMENKITKMGFSTKMRMIYLARKEVFASERSINAFFGALNQFNVPSCNGLRPVSNVNTSYFFKDYRGEYRKSMLMNAYKQREMSLGPKPYVLNIEELATVWHFPLSHVRTPLLQKTQGKRAEPPPGLPMEGIGGSILENIPFEDRDGDGDSKEKKGRKIVTDAGDVAYLDDEDYG